MPETGSAIKCYHCNSTQSGCTDGLPSKPEGEQLKLTVDCDDKTKITTEHAERGKETLPFTFCRKVFQSGMPAPLAIRCPVRRLGSSPRLP